LREIKEILLPPCATNVNIEPVDDQDSIYESEAYYNVRLDSITDSLETGRISSPEHEPISIKNHEESTKISIKKP
jgi:hypothetical protein